MVIHENHFFKIIKNDGKVYLQTQKPGFMLKDFETVVRQNPRIKLTNFALLKKGLNEVSDSPVEIGIWLPSIAIEISRDKMSASLFVYETAEYIKDNVQSIQKRVQKLLAEANIIHGILNVNLENIVTAKATLIAQGTPPVKGEDAQIIYLELPERKPVIREDGKADYYDMNFIYEIEEGEWLGEKIHAQPGIPGMNVCGESIPAPWGSDLPLKYDHKSAFEVEEDGKTVLRSKISGVVEEHEGMVSVNHHLPIVGDVGIETGNIEFNGSVSIKGTVQPGFSVVANGDISIEHPEGVSGAKLIKSLDGDIFIRGGIFGLGETRVEAGGDIFVKHVNDAHLVAGRNLNIGFYSLGSNLSAHSVLVDERKGKIIGGTVIAKSTIVTACSGNRLERPTELIINSINKAQSLETIQYKASLLKSMQEDIVELETQIERILPVIHTLTQRQLEALELSKQKLASNKETALNVNREIKQLMSDLRKDNKAEIHVTKEAYPGTYIQIGKKSTVLTSITNGRFLIENGELNV
ncbi:FapA family protein [Solibacillus sp. FSL R5-0691]|uniref:DUF342 domain-containing protein n=1 Tax=Solibacillus sp. FSL R5-0691 TaxID=2921653 RepID=UPI0030D5D694